MPFLLGDCALDLQRREITRGTEVVAVGPQVFDLLLHLVRNHERVVTKDELLEIVWGGRIVSESTLNGHINAARETVARLPQLEPALTASTLRRRAPIFDARLMDSFLNALRKAGLPE